MKRITENVGTWLRGLVWTAMVFGCAWASAQSYLVSPGMGHYHVVAMGAGEGVGLGMGAEGAAQNSEALPKDDLFAGTEVFAKGASDITEITMDPDSLSLVGGPDARRAHNTILNVVRTYTYDKPGMYNMADVDAIRNKLNTGDWHCSVHIRDLKTGSGSDVCGKRRTDGMKETAIIEVEPKQLTFIHTIRREGAPGTSELGYFPMLPGMSGLTSLAMLNPELFAEMQIQMHTLPMMLPGSPMMLAMQGAHLYTLNSPEMKSRMDEMQKKLKELKVRPFSPEEMQKFKDEGKSFKLIVPDNDAAPKAAPAPVPTAPQSPQ